MAEKKYVRIPAKDLPDVIYVGGDNVYFARYRVISEDGTVFSRWSQKFEVPTGLEASDIALLSTEYSASKNSGVLNATWNVDRLFTNDKMFVNRFHVYVRFHTNNEADAKWTFAQETSATNFSTIIPDNKKADIAVLIPTYRGLDATNISPSSPITLYPKSVLFSKTNIN
jgi:hypothetical protein